MSDPRRGSSLVEIVMALTLLAAGGLGAAAAMARGLGEASRAALLEETLGRAGAIMDSLLVDPEPEPGELELIEATVSWEIDVPDPGLIEVTLLARTVRDDQFLLQARRSHRLVASCGVAGELCETMTQSP